MLRAFWRLPKLRIRYGYGAQRVEGIAFEANQLDKGFF